MRTNKVANNTFECECPTGYWGPQCEFTPCDIDPAIDPLLTPRCTAGTNTKKPEIFELEIFEKFGKAANGDCKVYEISARNYDWKCDCNNGYGSKACDLTACSSCTDWNSCTENCDNAPTYCDSDSTCSENCDCSETDGGLALCDGQVEAHISYVTSVTYNISYEPIKACKHWAQCSVSAAGMAQCACIPGTSGARCENGPCEKSPCLNSGVCLLMGIHSVNDIGFEDALGPRLKTLYAFGHIHVSDVSMLVTTILV